MVRLLFVMAVLHRFVLRSQLRITDSVGDRSPGTCRMATLDADRSERTVRAVTLERCHRSEPCVNGRCGLVHRAGAVGSVPLEGDRKQCTERPGPVEGSRAIGPGVVRTLALLLGRLT